MTVSFLPPASPARSGRRGARLADLGAFIVLGLGLVVTAPAFGYPGGTPDFQTDVAPFCSACHASTKLSDLDGAPGDRAEKELAENKHYTLVASGSKTYAELTAEQRTQLVELLKAVDANATIEIDYPPQVAPGETFQITVRVVGGGGPVVGVGLVDRPHRWYAKPASSAGWTVVGAPTIIGPKGSPQTEWLSKRPERYGRGITYVNVTDWKSSAETGSWAKAKVIYTLKAPDKPGDYPLVGTFWYGTEKAIKMSTQANPMYGDQPLGGYTGKSGRVKFSAPYVISVK
jgi:hypothetical protein